MDVLIVRWAGLTPAEGYEHYNLGNGAWQPIQTDQVKQFSNARNNVLWNPASLGAELERLGLV
jgi:hypothetical protein